MSDWQKQKAEKCGCMGHNDLCGCQNEDPADYPKRCDLPPTHAQIMADPNAVHINLLRGTIAKPTVAQIIHLYGADTLRAALAQLKEPKQ